MKNISKSFLIITIALFALSVGVIALAQENTSEQISAQTFGTATPSLLPDNPFYFLKEWTRRVKMAFTFNEIKKTELENKFANEKLLELRKMTENKAAYKKIQKAAENYQKAIEKVKNTADKIKDKAENNPEVNKFLEKFTNQQILHEKILEKLETQVPKQALEKIKEARERHIEKFSQVIQKLENRQDKIKEKIENALQNGDASNPKILDKIKEKMPEEIKQKIKEIKTNQKICTQEYAPVCGSDGKTYSNKCIAKNNGVEIDYDGECGSKKECQIDFDCPQPDCAPENADATNCIGKLSKCINGKCVTK